MATPRPRRSARRTSPRPEPPVRLLSRPRFGRVPNPTTLQPAWPGLGADTGCMRITIRVRPGSARPGAGGEYDGALVVRVSARAVDGKATEAALAVVAASFGVPRSAVRLVSGASSRTKIVDIDADDPRILAALLAAPGHLPPQQDIAAVRSSITDDVHQNANSALAAKATAPALLARISPKSAPTPQTVSPPPP
jgi:uncharacterized protein